MLGQGRDLYKHSSIASYCFMKFKLEKAAPIKSSRDVMQPVENYFSSLFYKVLSSHLPIAVQHLIFNLRSRPPLENMIFCCRFAVLNKMELHV